jgi:hypothetical protein
MIQGTLIAGAAGLVLAVGAYFYGRHEGAKLEEAKHVLAEERVRQSEIAMQRIAAEAISAIEITNRTIRAEVQREIIEKPVYRECRADAGVLDAINAAKTGQPFTGPVLPGTPPAS